MHTPQLRQSALTECGLTALAIIFAWHGLAVSLERLRNEIGSSRLGLTARQLLELARRYDFETKACRREIDQLATLPLPFIAHYRFIHFVVVEHVTDQHVTINDPASGPQRLTIEEFARDFTGIALTFVPRFAPRPPVHPARREFWLQLGDNRVAATIILLLCLLQTSAVAFGLVSMAKALDGHQHPSVALLAWILAAKLHLLLYWSTENFAERLSTRARDLTWQRFKSMPPQWFSTKTANQLADILTLGERWSLLLPIAVSLLRSLLLIPVLLVAPLIQLPIGLVIASLTAIASCIVLAACLRRGETRMRRMREAQLLILPDTHILADLESRQFAGRDSELTSYLAAEHAQMHSHAQVDLGWQAKLDVLVSLPIVLALAIIMTDGLFTQEWGTAASLGTVCVVIGLCLRTARRSFPAISEVMGLLSRLHDLRNTDCDSTGLQSQPGSPAGLAIHLDDTNLFLSKGDLLQITGPSGSGKTRLARQIAGLEPSPNGTITFDGMATETLCHQGSPRVLLVDEQVLTISGSLAENLCLGDSRFDRQALDAVLDLVELNQELCQRGGLDLELSAERRLLSGGQLRRLALARALLRQPSVIVLDGTLDALDAPLAGRIVERLRERHILVLIGERGTQSRRPDATIDLGCC
ncbi:MULTISPECIES: cysteine peptidase family C39 domain-containing protein [Rhizobium]|uniref:cysteine peptidase family C39 domain-containing protein n=1 Tax=Rhizobium TaxID=379 RepID=UPI0019323F8F|nr:cysteine peptidase family C39 domain-containing protein [Rhizobium rosettiformans]